MLRRAFPLLFFFISLADSQKCFFRPYYEIIIDEEKAEIIGREDLMGRNEYERLITVDPKTGEIPQGIRQAEIDFTNELVMRFF